MSRILSEAEATRWARKTAADVIARVAVVVEMTRDSIVGQDMLAVIKKADEQACAIGWEIFAAAKAATPDLKARMELKDFRLLFAVALRRFLAELEAQDTVAKPQCGG